MEGRKVESGHRDFVGKIRYTKCECDDEDYATHCWLRGTEGGRDVGGGLVGEQQTTRTTTGRLLRSCRRTKQNFVRVCKLFIRCL